MSSPGNGFCFQLKSPSLAVTMATRKDLRKVILDFGYRKVILQQDNSSTLVLMIFSLLQLFIVQILLVLLSFIILGT